ncbi:hypothetical protein C8R47DRAFT_1218504 [Mycena vitilis]|nr:hypothetical protein C8R47DRAFT_1218504 [Mycena vitilis]
MTLKRRYLTLPKPIKSPKKPVTSAAFVDDEAEESDDGVLVEKPADGSDGLSEQEDRDVDEAGHSEYDYGDGFINDGRADPYEEVEPDSPIPQTPPPSPSKSSKRVAKKFVKDESLSPAPIPAKKRTVGSSPSKSPAKSQRKPGSGDGEVIELASSDEDLTAMDVDDSALPPSLLTRGAAEKLGIKVAPVTEVDDRPVRSGTNARTSERAAINTDSSPSAISPPVSSPAPRPVPALDPEMATALAAWMDSYMAGRAADPQNPKGGASKKRVDHDALAVAAAIEATSSGALAAGAAAAPVLTDAYIRSLSPDWDPPYAGDLGSPSKTKSQKSRGKARQLSPSRGMPTASQSVRTSAAKSSPKGKRKQDAPSDTEDQTAVVASSASKRVKREVESEDISQFVTKTDRPVVAADGGTSGDSAPLTMAQYARVAKGEEPSDIKDEASPDDNGVEDVDTVFLEDLEVYKAYYNPKAPCGVFDIDLQDPALRPYYVGLAPLPAGRRVVASYDPHRNSLEDIDYSTGGRVQYGSWYTHNPRMLAKNSMGAMLFERAHPNFINPARVPPLDLACKVSAGSTTTQRLYVGDRIAICVSAVCCMESHVVAPKRVGAKSERMRKWFNGVFHDQDWERVEAIFCLVFHERLMFGQIVDKAVSFQSMLSPDPRNVPDAPTDRNTRGVPSAMFSSRSPTKPSPNKATSSSAGRRSAPVKTLLAHNDPIPVYDARKKVINFDADLERLDQVLPLFPGEIPSGSFTIVGYTVSSYMATVSGTSERLAHIGFNILWLIVCGTPSMT